MWRPTLKSESRPSDVRQHEGYSAPLQSREAVMTDVLPGSPLSFGVTEVAEAQKRVLLAVLATMVANGLLRATSGGAAGAMALLLDLAVAAFAMYCVYRLCRALGVTPWAYVVAMLVPLVSLVCLFVLNGKATAFLKAHGVRVGFLGAKA